MVSKTIDVGSSPTNRVLFFCERGEEFNKLDCESSTHWFEPHRSPRFLFLVLIFYDKNFIIADIILKSSRLDSLVPIFSNR